ncbi:ABC transporter ATP-binding protein [Clostridium felsineum]|uniref:Iron import ATP-binding/permease protein IrtA n=1 Tax=Clostridium felsineum TaxID=36839 RepID=A0A1S8MHM2_9CLOT|nr:ABC transporter ATP-binding protein [Clostridium felsineum]URZ07057.1 Iron import ATP-binding/permease protein IrtA [Clostridium felsineum]URZ12087.1 Iron import ATP-binding/permease protein IrtA [Clostridium felsineum]
MKKESSISKLFGYAGSFKYLTIASWILSAVSALMALIPFILIWKIIKEVLKVAPNFSSAKNLTYYGWLAVLFSVISMIIYIAALICSHIAAFRVQANIRSKAMHHIITLPLGFMDSIGSGKIRKIVNESSAATETYLAHQLPDSAGALVTPIGLIAMLLIFDWRLGLVSLVPVVIAFAIMLSMTGAKMQQKMKEYQNSLEQMSNEAVEYVRGIPVVKTFGQSFFSFKRFKAAIDNYEKWVISYTKDLRIPMMLYTTAINSTFAVLIAAALFFTRNKVSDNFLLNLLFYIIITPVITVTLNKIMYSSENMMIVEDALERIDSVMNMKPLYESTAPKHPKDNSIILDDVLFHYKDVDKNALKHVSLKINSGEHVAFVGPSGSGKTTLASIIARFWDVDSGEVIIGGINVKNISKEELMNTVSFVFQDSKLLKTSILENVRLAKPDATREEVLQALKDAMCEDIIEKMTNGMDTIIGVKGNYLSGGEAQRISIARAMLKNPPILILDEATAFADPDNESKVQAAFSTLSKGKTVLMIAHRLSTVTGMDQIYVIKDGEICEVGNHSKLMQKQGLYAHMWQQYNSAAKWKVGV